MRKLILALVANILCWTSMASAVPIQWTVASGGNGHWYELVLNDTKTWQASQASAEARGGYLATVTSAAENIFITSSVLDFDFLAPCSCTWLGGFQNTASPTYSEPSGGWEWVIGEPFAYSNSQSGEPNNSGSGGTKQFPTFWFSPGAWNAHFDGTFNRVVEWNANPIPEPSTALLLGLGLLEFSATRKPASRT